MRGLLLALLLAAPAQAQRTGEVGFTVDQWGGLNTRFDSSRIGDFDAQQADNVLTDMGRLEKRTGNARIATILAGYEVKLVREFVPASLTRYLLAHSSQTVYQTSLGADPVAIGTVTASANIDGAQALNKFIFQDGTATPWYWDGTSTAAVPSMPVSKYIEYGAGERVILGNLPSQSGSRVAISSYGSVSWFTVPANVNSNAEAPNTFDFQREDGDTITCVKATRCGVFVGKNNSTHILKGYDNLTYRKDVISSNIGCRDDRSVQDVDGNIIWLGQDAVYSWSCNGAPEAISRDIDGIIKLLRQNQNFSAGWVLNTQADFADGLIAVSGGGAPMSLTIDEGSVTPSTSSRIDTSSTDFAAGTLTNLSITDVVGSVVLSSNVARDEFTDGDYTTGNTTWTVVAVAGAWSVVTAGATQYIQPTSNVDSNFIYTTSLPASSGSWKWTWNSPTTCSSAGRCFRVRFMQRNPQAATLVGDYYALDLFPDYSMHIMKSVATTLTNLTAFTLPVGSRTGDHVFEVQKQGSVILVFVDSVFLSSTTDSSISSTEGMAIEGSATAGANNFTNIYIYQYKSTGSFTSQIFDTALTTPTWGATSSTYTAYNAAGEGNIAFYVQSSTAGDGGGFGSLVSSSDTIQPALAQKRYWRYRLDFSSLVSTKTPRLDEMGMTATTTGYYYSPVHFLGSAITTYGTLDMLETVPSGSTITYAVRAATYSFLAYAASPSWTTTANHTAVSIAVSTPVYFQYSSFFQPSNADNPVELNRSQLAWQEGSGLPVASGYKDGRYFLCATIAATATYPDTCLIRQRNQKWVKMNGFTSASMARFNNDLVIGDGSTNSRVWKILQNDVYNDDTAVIVSTWVSKDFMFAPNGRDWAVGEKVLNEIWLDTELSSATYLNVGYAVNKTTTYVEGMLDLGAYGDAVNRPIPLSTTGLGKYFRLKLYNNDLDKSIKVNAFSIYGEPKEKTND